MFILELLSFVAIISTSYCVFLFLSSAEAEDRKIKRIKMLLTGVESTSSDSSLSAKIKERSENLINKFVSDYVKAETKNSLVNDLYLAGRRSKGSLSEFYLERFAFLIMGLGFGVILNLQLPAMLACGGVGFLLPKFNLEKILRERQRKIKASFPLALDMIVISLEAGYNIDRALNLVIEDLGKISGGRNNIMIEEFKVLINELQLGLDSQTAWNNLYRRTQIDEIKQFIAAVLQSEKIGSTLAATLRNLSIFLIKRRGQELESLAASLGAKMTLPLALCILPVILAFVTGPFIVELLQNKPF